MRRKITLSTLNELSCVISHDDLACYQGGGSGTSYRDPYTINEYMALGWSFQRGWVQLSDGNISYLTENYPTYCGNSTYCCSGYEGSTNYWGNSWYNNSGGYYGSSASLYDRAYIKISELVNQLPAELRARLSNVAFEYNSVMLSSGQYDPKSNTIYLQQLDYNTLFRECVHAIQENEGLCGTNHAAKEFQEHVIGDVCSHYYYERNNKPIPNESTAGTSESTKEWSLFLYDCVDSNGVNMKEFLNAVNNYVFMFQQGHSTISDYQGYISPEYEYNWAEMFRIMGIPTY